MVTFGCDDLYIKILYIEIKKKALSKWIYFTCESKLYFFKAAFVWQRTFFETSLFPLLKGVQGYGNLWSFLNPLFLSQITNSLRDIIFYKKDESLTNNTLCLILFETSYHIFVQDTSAFKLQVLFNTIFLAVGFLFTVLQLSLVSLVLIYKLRHYFTFKKR